MANQKKKSGKAKPSKGSGKKPNPQVRLGHIGQLCRWTAQACPPVIMIPEFLQGSLDITPELSVASISMQLMQAPCHWYHVS